MRQQPSIQLVIATAKGTFIRSVRPATVLPTDASPGYAAEDATRSAAARWGLPDFVFRPEQRRRGTATRELGDAIVVVGRFAASVQVKSRVAETDTDVRERAWLDKKIEKAANQARGTIKTMTSAGDVTLTNERGRRIRINGLEKTWLVVVVLDHPGLDGYLPTEALVLLRRDWEFLFEQLKSTYAVMEYLYRVSTKDRIQLGEEAVRYYQLAAADAATTPPPLDERLAHSGGRQWAAPLLPQAPAGQGDIGNFLLLRGVLEDVATARLPEGVTYEDMFNVLSAIDSAPVGYRVEQGAWWFGWLREFAKSSSDDVPWRSRSLIGDGRPYLLFAAAPRFSQSLQEQFADLVKLRHDQHIELVPERAHLPTIGILLTPRLDKFGPWDTTVIGVPAGAPAMTSEARKAFEQVWGPLLCDCRHGDDPSGHYLWMTCLQLTDSFCL